MTKRKGEAVAKTATKRNFQPLGPPPAAWLELVGSLRNLRLSQGIKTRDLASHLNVTIGVISAAVPQVKTSSAR